MKFSIWFLLMLVALAISIVPVTAQDTAEGFPLMIEDGAGRELTFEKPPERVIALWNGNYGQLASLGVRPVAAVAGHTWFNDPVYFFEDGESIPAVEAADGSIDLELVASFEPDLILVISQEEAQQMEGIAPVFVNEGINTFTLDGFADNLRALGRILAAEEAAEAAITDFDNRLEAYKRLTADQGDPTVLIFRAWGNQNFYAYTTATPACLLLNEVATCEWINPSGGTGAYQTSYEGVLSLDPDVILLGYNGAFTEDDVAALFVELEANPLWNELSAVKNDRVVYIEGYSNQSVNSLASAVKFLDVIVPRIFPDVFPDGPLSDEQIQDILGDTTANTDRSEAALSIVDGTGTTLTFDTPPQRIVCLYTRCMELLAALEFSPVGTVVSAESFTTDPHYFPQPNDIALIEWDGDVPNLEQLVALEPDLVLGWAELMPLLDGIAPVYSVINEQDSYQESHEEIRAFAQLLGREDIAEANITASLDRLAAYQQLSPGDVSVMDMFFSNDAGYYRDGQSGTCNLLKEVALCDWPDPQNVTSWSVPVNDEALLQLDPDVLIVSTYGFEGLTEAEIRAALGERPLWGELAAIQSGRVYIEPDDLNLDGMGTVGMNRMLDYFMPLLYPDVFPEPLTDEQVQAILAQ